MNLERLNSIRTKKTADGRFISFVKNDTQLTFAAADEWCRSVGGHLPIPKNENENDLLGGTWLGFTVNDKDTLTYFNWATGHPNDDSDNVHTVNKQWYTKKNVIQRAICYLSISDNENLNFTIFDTSDKYFPADYEIGANLTVSTIPDTQTTTTTTSPITTTLTGTNIIIIVLSTY